MTTDGERVNETDDNVVLSVRSLYTHFSTDLGDAQAVDGVSFDLHAGKTLALVGESGCGKSVTALSIMRLIPEPPGKISADGVYFHDRNLLDLSPVQMRKIRGNDISMIFQEPMTSLNPVFKVGSQIASVLRLHRNLSKDEGREAAVDLLEQVGIPSPRERIDDFPHQMSGGMRQRVMIAMALACDPDVLIADEPTTALDVTIQAQILDLLRSLQAERNMAILLITHDLGVVAEMAHEVAVMYAGKICEKASVNELYTNPCHPYTAGLFQSLPQWDVHQDRLYTIRGQVPAATDFPPACRFHPRCPYVFERCSVDEPPFIPVGADHEATCWLHDRETMESRGRPTGLPEEVSRR